MHKLESGSIRTYSMDAETDSAQITVGRNRRRLGIFLGTLLLSSLVGLAYTFIRPAIYQSTATLLVTLAEPATARIQATTDTPTMVTERSPRQNDPYYVATQRQVLTSQEILTQLSKRLSGKDTPELAGSANDLRDKLEAAPVGDTNMIELHARGSQPEGLPLLLNTWIEIYLTAQRNAERSAAASTVTILQQQVQELKPRIAAKRQQLDQFRQRHDIVSTENLENPAPAQLKGLQEALSKAREREITAKGQLAALKETTLQGNPVLRNQDQARVDALQRRADNLRERLRQFSDKFTPKYMALDPDIVSMTQNLEKLERQIVDARQQSQKQAVAEAEREFFSARQTVTDLQQQLTARQQAAQAFTARITEHKALQQELEQLEQLHQQTQARLTQEEIAHQKNFPTVTVLSQPTLPSAPIYPSYARDAGLSLAGSLLLAILAVGLYELLNRSPTAPARSEPHFHFFALPEMRPTAMPHTSTALPDQAALPQIPPRLELTVADVSALLAVADPAGRLLIALLLSGLSVEEAISLRWEQVDLKTNQLQVVGASPRSIPLSGLLRVELTRQAQDPLTATAAVVQRQEHPLTPEDATVLLDCIAHDADIAEPDGVTSQQLRHTYLAFLVRQGIRLTELEQIVGHLTPTVLAQYKTLSPPHSHRPLEQIDRIYPALYG